MRWTVVLVAEMEKGQRVEQPLLSLVRDQQVVLEQLGLTLAEGKRLLQAVQQRVVAAQVSDTERCIGAADTASESCPPRGTQRRWLRSAFGKVPIRVRRLTTCRCQGVPRRTFSSLPRSGSYGLIAPEWLYLQAKLASLIPFVRVAALLSDVLPANEGLVRPPRLPRGSSARGRERARVVYSGTTASPEGPLSVPVLRRLSYLRHR
jgi:hypothetical protein